MAYWDVTEEMAELESLGYIPAELEARIRWLAYRDGRWLAGGRQCETRVLQLLDEARAGARMRRFHADVESGFTCSWQQVSGASVIRGQDLREGDVVTVTRRDGVTTLEVVGPIVAHLLDGTRLAKVGNSETPRADRPDSCPASLTAEITAGSLRDSPMPGALLALLAQDSKLECVVAGRWINGVHTR